MIELAISVAVLTTISLSSLLVLLPVSRQRQLNREVEVAATEVRKIVENAHASPMALIPTLYPDGSKRTVPNLNAGQIVFGYDDPTADPLVMSSTVTWQSEIAGPISRTFWTVRTK